MGPKKCFVAALAFVNTAVCTSVNIIVNLRGIIITLTISTMYPLFGRFSFSFDPCGNVDFGCVDFGVIEAENAFLFFGTTATILVDCSA